MLLPDNIHPEQSIYYNGSFVLRALRQNQEFNLLSLYQETLNLREMSLPVFVLCLDWLFLLDAVRLNEQGSFELCS